MRKGVEGLCGIIRTYQYSPTNQDVYVFANKSRTLIKMLHWERGGFVVYYKWLEQGRLSPSIFHHKHTTAFIDIRWDEMVLLMEGIDSRVLLARQSVIPLSVGTNYVLTLPMTCIT